ncbi:hypothetical protein, variant, partial [Aphanomyces invadans]
PFSPQISLMWRQVARGIRLQSFCGPTKETTVRLHSKVLSNNAGRVRHGAIRTFSGSSAKDPPTTFQRAIEDKARYVEWDESGVFSPDMFAVKKMALFAMIHQAFPNKCDFDLPEFLDGAKHALELVLRTVYSPAFLEAAVDSTIENDEIRLLKDVMSPECLNMLKQGFKIHHDNGCTKFDLTQLDIRGCFLNNIKLADDNSSILLTASRFPSRPSARPTQRGCSSRRFRPPCGGPSSRCDCVHVNQYNDV